MPIKVSIIIPAYNLEKYIERCIRSCSIQTYKLIEIIVVDDGSNDCTGTIIDNLAIQIDNLIAIHKSNGGVTSAREEGINIADGEYLFFLDADDYLPENAIQILVNRAIETNADIIDGNYALVDESENITKKKSYSFDILKPEDYLILILNLRQVYLCFKLIRKKLYNNIIILKEITLGEDAICYVQLVKNASSIAKCEGLVYYYFRRNNSITKSPKPQDLIHSYRSSEWIYEFIDRHFNSQGIKHELAGFRLLQIIQYLHRLKITGPYRKDIRKVIKESLKTTGLFNTGLSFVNNKAILLSYVNVNISAIFLQAFYETKRLLYSVLVTIIRDKDFKNNR